MGASYNLEVWAGVVFRYLKIFRHMTKPSDTKAQSASDE